MKSLVVADLLPVSTSNGWLSSPEFPPAGRPATGDFMYYFSFNYGDFARKTAGMSEKNKLAYLYLISMYYQEEKPIANELKRLALKTGLKDDQKMYELLFAMFDQRGDFWHDEEIDKAILEYQTNHKKYSERGKAGAKVRWLRAIEK
jgi:uncharacterized protein YdaU (DUF1376 family)